MEFQRQPRRSDRRRRGKASLLRMNYSQRSATTDYLLCTSECWPEWKVRFRRVVGRHPYVAPSVEWEDMESPELYVKQETVSTTSTRSISPTNLGTEFALSVARWANMDDTTEKRIYTRRMYRTCYNGNFDETSSPLIRRSEFIMEWTEHLVFVWWFSEHEVVQATVIESEKSCSHVGAGSKCLSASTQMRALGLVMVF